MHVLDIPDDFPLSEKQADQVRIAKTKEANIDRSAISQFLKSMRYALAYLDFETHNPAVPRFDGYRPYQQIPFQFSLHVQDAANSPLQHHELLHLERTEPDELFMSALQKVLPSTGSVIVWNKGFEASRLREIASRHPACAAFVADITSRLVDLADVFSQGHYLHPDFRGSYSIKAVLPVLVPLLSYDELAIKDGSAAQLEWNNIVTGAYDEAKARSAADDLRRYCKLDTLAMVKIVEHLQQDEVAAS